MTPFTPDYVDFFKELAANNKKEWFDTNKKRYESSVKLPFLEFTTELIKRINADDSSINPEPKSCIFRINRDVRFSNDKTPYKLHCSAVITRGGKKDTTTPGAFVQAGAEDIRIYGGAHNLDKNQLYDVREHIANNMTEFSKLVSDKAFVATYGKLHGE